MDKKPSYTAMDDQVPKRPGKDSRVTHSDDNFEPIDPPENSGGSSGSYPAPEEEAEAEDPPDQSVG